MSQGNPLLSNRLCSRIGSLKEEAVVGNKIRKESASSRQMGIFFPPMASPVNKASPGATPVKSTRREGRAVKGQALA
ncbi:hypothetical protein SLA2020_354240 [Shorea laevis]